MKDRLSVDFIFSVLFGLLFGFFFGLIDATIFLVTQDEVTRFLVERFQEPMVVNLIQGSISASVSLLVFYWIEMQTMGYELPIMKHPLLDCIGIVLGAICVASLYMVFKHTFLKPQIQGAILLSE